MFYSRDNYFFAVILSVIGFIYDGSFIGPFVLSMMYICSKLLLDNKVVDSNGDDGPLTMKERLGVVMVVVLVTIFLSFITVDWSVIF